MSAFRLDGRVALVTGARTGIGGSIAHALAAAGAQLVLANRTMEAARDLAATLRALGTKVHVLPYAATEQDCRSLVTASLAATGGQLDIVCHNAGGCEWSDLEQLTAANVRSSLAVNLETCFWLTQAALPALKRSPQGRIVITSSITGPRVAMAGATHYAAAKAGVNGFIRAAALELAAHRITVNGVEPGLVAKDRGRLSQEANLQALTRYIPLGRAGRPEDIAAAVHFLASAEAAWMTGQTIVVDGGMTLPESGFAMQEIWERSASKDRE